MTKKTESRIVLAFALAAAISVGMGAIAAVLPSRGPAAEATAIATVELPTCAMRACWW
jgi:hypothetical protein